MNLAVKPKKETEPISKSDYAKLQKTRLITLAYESNTLDDIFQHSQEILPAMGEMLYCRDKLNIELQWKFRLNEAYFYLYDFRKLLIRREHIQMWKNIFTFNWFGGKKEGSKRTEKQSKQTSNIVDQQFEERLLDENNGQEEDTRLLNKL